MNILLTNDDGIDSEKLLYTKSVLDKFGTVYVVAPSMQQSAKSMSLTIGGNTFEKRDDFTYAVDGTPVDCVRFAHAGLKLNPDLVVSGTNHGYNIGIDISYSGTVGACKQAQYYGYKTIALSADRKGNKILEDELERTLKYIFDKELPSSSYTLNVNFPREKFIQTNGIKETEVFQQEFEYIPTFEGNKFIPNRQYVMGQDLPENSDARAYKEGFTSISKVYI